MGLIKQYGLIYADCNADTLDVSVTSYNGIFIRRKFLPTGVATIKHMDDQDVHRTQLCTNWPTDILWTCKVGVFHNFTDDYVSYRVLQFAVCFFISHYVICYFCLRNVTYLFCDVALPLYVYHTTYRPIKSKVKQSLYRPEGSRRMRRQDFVTVSTRRWYVFQPPHRPPLPSRKYSWYSFLLVSESTPWQ